ncbi:hypothetical protein PILCRDRAFT_828457 [Piloderma croceum F 1598]|uniref:Major facilitator superfamily (MFS) profile domain-containing protein n=1 Tax=Piloderma croceum (strain F 1598) TaxID=765440 RepID=A0A0C3F277_PILCF|nr:hypothetical protein PILCRDRAFT_828457 [Piloderma croceum F 1598]
MDRPDTATTVKEEMPLENVLTSSTSEFPEGGFAGWATVTGAFLVQFCGFGYTTSFGVYQDFYTREYLSHQSSAAISWIGSINALLVISMGLVVGRLYDRGYFYTLMYCGSALTSFSLFMLSLAQPNRFYQVLLSQGLGVGIGSGILYIPSMAVVSHYFVKRRALAMTIVASGSSLGAVVHPIMLNNMLAGPLGFGNAVRASAGLVTGLLFIACLLMRTRISPPKHSIDMRKVLKKFSRDGAYMAATVGMTLFIAGFYYPLFYLQLDAISHGLNKKFAFYSLVIVNVSAFVGRLSPGLYANALGVDNAVTISAGCCSALILGMIGVKSVTSVAVIGVIYGFFAGVYISTLAPLLAVLTDDISELGARMGIAFAVSGLGNLIGTPISGLLLTRSFIWWRPALFNGVETVFICWSWHC